MKRIRIIAAVMAVLAGGALMLFLTDLKKQDKEATMPVLVALEPIPEKTVVTAAMVELREIPVSAHVEGAASSLTDAVGTITNSRVEKGEQVMLARLTSDEDGSAGAMSYSLPEGWRAVTVRVDRVSGVGGYLRAGDSVDVISAFSVAEGGSDKVYTVAVQMLSDVKVLAAGKVTVTDAAGGSTEYEDVTLKVDQAGALKIALAESEGTLKLALRPAAGDKSSKPAPCSSSEIIASAKKTGEGS